MNYSVRLTVMSATAQVMGTYSLESPTGTKLFTNTVTNPTTSQLQQTAVESSVPLVFASGTVIRVVCSPLTSLATTWIANFGGYEI